VSAPPTPAGDGTVLEARGLVKRFRDFTAVDGMDLTVLRGDVYGFLGPNGSGKSTTIRMVLGLVRPTAGTVRVLGRDPHVDGQDALQGVAGFVESPGMYPYLSAEANLRLLGALDRNPDPPVDRVLEQVELSRRRGDKVGTFSQGMKQRLAIAGALLREPELLILDEPTNGLDPGGMREVRDLVRDLADHGITILLSSHLLSEVEQLCNRGVVVARGRAVAEGTLAELAGPEGRYALETTDHAAAVRVLTGLDGVTSAVADAEHGGRIVLVCDPERIAEVGFALMRAGVGIRALVPRRQSLEDRFLELVEGRATP
jgi:ABC-2 type transport system ATP-binding protein